MNGGAEIKEIGMIVIFTVCTYIGFYAASNMKKRLKILENIEKTVTMLRGEINYKATALEEALENIKNGAEGNIGIYINNVVEEMNKYNGSSMKEIAELHKNVLKNTPLKKKDIDEFAGLIGNLGFLDKEMQLSVIDMYVGQLHNCQDECKDEINKNYKMYRYLGAFVGAMVCILIA